MKIDELKNLIFETIAEQTIVDYRQHPNRGVSAYYSLLARVKPQFLDLYLELYDVMVNEPSVALETAERLGIDSGVVKWHQKNLADGTGLPSSDDLHDALILRQQEREAALQKRRKEERKIKVVDPASLSTGPGKSLYDIEATTEDEARKEWSEKFGRFPGKSQLYLDLEGNYFVWGDYGRLGT
jgi:hypothetical protein